MAFLWFCTVVLSSLVVNFGILDPLESFRIWPPVGGGQGVEFLEIRSSMTVVLVQNG